MARPDSRARLFEKRQGQARRCASRPTACRRRAGCTNRSSRSMPMSGKTYALRIVAQRCLYGVDKNPLAAEMAKLSLWLLTLAKDKPFTFLDHAIRCGDSLVGIHDLKQLENLTLTGAEQYGRVWLESLQTSIRQAKELRQKLETMSANNAQAVAEQEALHKDAERLTVKLRAVADLLIADAINQVDVGVVLVAARFRESSAEALQADANKLLKGQRTFHWPLEFPEVMLDRGGFDAFVGNPPFLGGTRISTLFGSWYAEFLRLSYPSFTEWR